MMSHPPSLFALTSASGLERPKSTLPLNNVAASPWMIVASLEPCRGTQMAEVDKTLGGDDGTNVVEVRRGEPMWLGEIDGR